MALRDYMYAKHTDRDIVTKINTTGEQPRPPVEHRPKTFRVIHRSKSPKGRKSVQQQQLQETTKATSPTPPNSPPLAAVASPLTPNVDGIDSHCTPTTCRNCPSCDKKSNSVPTAHKDQEPRTPVTDLAPVPILYQEELVPSSMMQQHFSTMKLDEVDFTHVY